MRDEYLIRTQVAEMRATERKAQAEKVERLKAAVRYQLGRPRFRDEIARDLQADIDEIMGQEAGDENERKEINQDE